MDAGAKIDALVAEKVMGWVREPVFTYATPEPGFNITGNERVRAADDVWSGTYYRISRDVSRRGFPWWEPSTDIAAAWLVVEKMKNERNFAIEFGQDDKLWRGWLWREGEFPSRGVTAETAPLAICRTALKAVGFV